MFNFQLETNSWIVQLEQKKKQTQQVLEIKLRFVF